MIRQRARGSRRISRAGGGIGILGETRGRTLVRALGTLGALALLPGLASCQRSAQYRHDQDYVSPDAPNYPASARGAPGGALTSRVEAMGQPKKRVVVLNFWNDTPVRQADLGGYAADELRRTLLMTQRLLLPSDAKSDLGTEDFVQGEKVKVAQLVREGRRLGVSILVIGRVTHIAYRQRGDEIGILRQKQALAAADVEIKIFDVQGGREVMAVAKSGDASSNAVTAVETSDVEAPSYKAELVKIAVRNAVHALVPEVLRAMEKMQWQGRIVKIAGTKIYINAGRSSGLVVGDILKALTPGDDIYDPATGAFLGRAPGQLKGTLEVADFLGPDGAIVELHTGGNFQEGDQVQLY